MSGPNTPGHVAIWATPSTTKDGGTASAGLVNSLGLYGNGGTPFGIVNSATPAPFSGSYTILGAGVSQTAAYLQVNGSQGLPFQIQIDGITGLQVSHAGVTLPTPLAPASGGTGLSSIPANGQLLIGNGTGYTLGTLTAGPGVSITNGAGFVTIGFNGTGTGTVTSVQLATGSTGLTVNGGTTATITTSGAFNLAGTLAAGYGGTGVSNASLTPITATGSTTARTLGTRAADAANVKDFGAVGDGVTDDTAAIQAAIAAACSHTVNGQSVGGTVYFPAGNYKFTSTLTVTTSNVYLKGDGPGASFLFPAISTTADAIYFAANCQRVGAIDIAIYNQISDPTNGAMLHLYKNNLVFLSNVDVSGGFYGIWIDGTTHMSGANVNITGDANMTSAKAGSALLYLTPSGTTVPAELHFSNCDWRGQNGNNYLNYAVYVQGCDGLFLSDAHLGFCQIGLGTSPATSTTPILSILADQLYLDTCSQYGASFTGYGYTGLFGLHALNITDIYNCPVGVSVNCPSTDWSSIKGGSCIAIGRDAIQLYSGSKWRVQDVTAYNVNTSNSGGGGVNVGAAFSNFTIDGLVVEQGGGTYAPNFGIYLTAGAANFKIGANNKFANCTTDIVDNTTVTTKSIDSWMTDKNVSAFASAASFSMPVQPYFTMTGTTTITALSGVAWEGRQMTIVTTGGAVSFTSGATIANNFTSTQNVPFTCFYTAGKWYM